MQCPEKRCQAGGTRVHSLTKKSERLCLHTYLIFKAGLEIENQSTPVISPHEIDRKATVEEVTKLIKENFPTATSDPRMFLEKNKQFIEGLCKVKNINSELIKYVDKQCPQCKCELVKWPHKTKDSYLVSLAEVKKIKIEAQFCTKCKTLSYYNLYGVGCVPVNNKVRNSVK